MHACLFHLRCQFRPLGHRFLLVDNVINQASLTLIFGLFYLNIAWLISQMHIILQGGRVPPASNSRMPPLPHEPAGFYNDRGATVDIPLDSTKVHDLPLSLLLLCGSIFTRSALPEKNLITMLFQSNTVNMLCICSIRSHPMLSIKRWSSCYFYICCLILNKFQIFFHWCVCLCLIMLLICFM